MKENNATIEFYWAPLLVESNSDDPLNHRVAERTVRVQAIEKHARYWTDATFWCSTLSSGGEGAQ